MVIRSCAWLTRLDLDAAMSDKTERLAELRRKREASLRGRNGPPMAGYAERVKAIEAEIERLEAENGH